MISATLQRIVAGLTREERLELRDFIDITLSDETPLITDEEKSTIQRRAAEMEADPTLGLPWSQVYAELIAGLS